MRLHKTFALVIGMTYLSAQTARAVEIEGVEFADRYRWQETELQLNGVGLLRYRVFIKGYAAALYLGEQIAPERALDRVPRRLEIEYFWSIPAEKLSEAMLEGIARNVDAQMLQSLDDTIRQFGALYEDVEPGDRYAITYVPGVGTELTLNGERKGLVEGDDFSAALFSIWLGERALDATLRERLLAAG
jgi:hypothetical protein